MAHRVPGADGPIKFLPNADYYQVTAAATVALPTDSSGNTARYIFVSNWVGGVAITLGLAGDTTVAALCMQLPANSTIVLDCQGFSHLRYQKATGEAGTPELSIVPLECY